MGFNIFCIIIWQILVFGGLFGILGWTIFFLAFYLASEMFVRLFTFEFNDTKVSPMAFLCDHTDSV